MISTRLPRSLTLVALALSGIACSTTVGNEGNGGNSGNGGNGGNGGMATANGGAASGGTTAAPGGAGGGNGSGGQTTSGGTSAMGGRGGSGGQTATGGTATTGGVTTTGGSDTTGGTAATGGSSATGGVSATGGRTGAGGGTGRDAGPDLASGTGGAGTGGQSGTGGQTGTGGSGGTGGGTTAATSSAGCGKTPTLTSGSRTIQSSGSSRSFMLRIPPNYDNQHAYPLVFAFHWNGGTMNDIDGGGSSGYTWSYYGLREQADNSTSSKMIFVAPQGNGNGWANPDGKDLTLVDDMLKQLEGDLCVDTTRIFAMGFSYGGGMSYAIACARAKVFRAVAVYSGAQLSGCTGGNDPIAYLGIHGIGDPTCGISGGRSLRDRFVKNDTCTAQSPPEPTSGSGKHICTSYTGCSSGHPVRWCAFDGGHTPGNVDGGGDDGAKTWTKAESWQFFTQF